ncbi:MAG: GyrI-like domain-containing protein [Proteobacteria bacterium]|nr:GyrI-like domain-containing protein [Pseudomonadota bacterium]
MNEPTREHVNAVEVAGPQVRTTNAEETNPATARIGGLWSRFFAEAVPARTEGRTDDARNFGVYARYASDAHGAFDVIAGVAVREDGIVRVEGGDYLVFDARGEMPQAVMEGWSRIWQYFDAHPEVVRRYRSDFEAYTGPNDARIYIGVAH